MTSDRAPNRAPRSTAIPRNPRVRGMQKGSLNENWRKNNIKQKWRLCGAPRRLIETSSGPFRTTVPAATDPHPYNRKGRRAPGHMTEPAQKQSNQYDPSKNGRAPKTVTAVVPTHENGQPAVRQQDEDPVGKVYDAVLIRRLGHYLKPYWWQSVVSCVSVTLKSLADVTGPYLVKVAIDLRS